MKTFYKLILLAITIVSCNKKENNQLSIDDKAIEFCKQDLKYSSESPLTIVYDSTLTNASSIDCKYPYYKKELIELVEYNTEIDSTSKKWLVNLYFSSENKYGALLKNTVTYVVKENAGGDFAILMKRDENKISEYLAAE